MDRIEAVRHVSRGFLDFFTGPLWARRLASPQACDFVFGNPQEMALPGVVDAIRAASVPGDPGWFAYKTSEAEPRQAVAASLRDRLGRPFDPEDVLLTKGASAALAIVLQTVLAPGDEVLYITPPWFFYEAMILAAGGTPVPVDVKDLAEAINPWFRVWVYFAAYTGVRWGEMLGLRRKDFDLLRRTVTIERQLVEVQSRFVGFGPPKSAAGRRTITLPGFLATMLEEQLAERAQAGPDGLVFVNTVGNPPHASGFTAFTWARAKRRAGVEGVRWHDLRHTAVALAIEQGAHAKAIQERMGHASVSVTLDRYGHLLPSLGERIADGLDSAFQTAQHGAREVSPVAKLRSHRKTAG